MSKLAVIPARLDSQRLPRKALLKESGRTLIEHVHQRVQQVRGLDRIILATDSEEIMEAARGFGAEAMMTRADHCSGTDRVAEVAASLAAQGQRYEVVVNVQGDEPELDPKQVEQLLELMERGDPMATLAERMDDIEEARLPQVVKVVLDEEGRALYFSRSLMPYPARDTDPGGWLRHLGIYAFKADFLQTYTRLPASQLEQRERLEQLRALAHGYRIRVGVVEGRSGRGIDTREDYDAFLKRCAARSDGA